LPDSGGVASSIAFFRPHTGLASEHGVGLQRELCISYATHWRSFGYSGNKPVPFIMAKEEAVFFSLLTTQEQEMAVPRLRVQNYQLLHLLAVSRDEEVLSSRIPPNVEREILPHPPSTQPARLSVAKLHARADLLERAFQELHLHFQSKGICPVAAARAIPPAPHLGCSQGTGITVEGSNPGLESGTPRSCRELHH
jgi:hypothetical protein